MSERQPLLSEELPLSPRVSRRHVATVATSIVLVFALCLCGVLALTELNPFHPFQPSSSLGLSESDSRHVSQAFGVRLPDSANPQEEASTQDDNVGTLGQGVSNAHNRRVVTFTVNVACPPIWWKRENEAFWDAGIARVQVVLRSQRQPPPYEFNRGLPGGGLWEELHRVGDTKVFTGTNEIDDTCEYGFVLINNRGEERWEIGGANVRPALMNAECSSKTQAGGNVYHNRLMSTDAGNNTITTIFGGCQAECPIPCKIIALSDESGDNVYSVLERDRDEVWRKAEGHMVDVAAGFDDLWALDASMTTKYTHISSLNESGSGWTAVSVPSSSARTLDVGLEEAYFVATDGKYWSKPADNSGTWNLLPGALRQVGVGKKWMWGVTADGNWAWACELPCVGLGIHHDVPGEIRACEVGLDYVYCVNTDNELYRTDAEVDWIDPATGTRWSYPSHLPSVNVWDRVPGIAAKMASVGEENVWAIDTAGRIKYCALPCNDGNWKQPTGVPEGIIYLDASKFK